MFNVVSNMCSQKKIYTILSANLSFIFLKCNKEVKKLQLRTKKLVYLRMKRGLKCRFAKYKYKS